MEVRSCLKTGINQRQDKRDGSEGQAMHLQGRTHIERGVHTKRNKLQDARGVPQI